MKFKIENIYGFENTEFEIHEGATLITGKNSAGKTSAANIIAALVARDGNPSHISSASRKEYIRDGAVEGIATFNDTVSWRPKQGISAPPKTERDAGPHSVGLVSFLVGKSQADRAKIWEGLLLPDDPRALLEPHWTLPKAQLNTVLDTIEKGGWEDSAKLYDGQRKECKRRWVQITGAGVYGANKAAEWRPQGWTVDLEGASDSDLEAALVDARDHLQMISNTQAISTSQINEAMRVKETLLPEAEEIERTLRTELNGKHIAKQNELQAEVNQREKEIKELRVDYESAQEILKAIPPHTCPSCDANLEIKAGELVLWSAASEDELNVLAADVEAIKGNAIAKQKSLNGFKTDLAAIGTIVSEKKDELQRQRGKVSTLKRQSELADATAVDEVDQGERATAQQAVQETQILLDAFRKRQLAQREHDNVVHLSAVMDLLGPSGVRFELMQKKMDVVRKFLKRVEDLTGWMPLGIGTDYSITSGGRPIQLVAKNEKLKAQWSFQIACALLSGDRWCLLDEADTLRNESWDGLINLVNGICAKYNDIRVIVCATSAEVDGWTKIEL